MQKNRRQRDVSEDGSVLGRLTVLTPGDILGTGRPDIAQAVRMAQELNGSRPLEGVCCRAGLLTGRSRVSLADLVRLARIQHDGFVRRGGLGAFDFQL